MTGRLRPEDELCLILADRLRAHRHITLTDAEIHNLVHELTADWHVTRINTPSEAGAPLRTRKTLGNHGHYGDVRLPWRPESDAERAYRAACEAAMDAEGTDEDAVCDSDDCQDCQPR